MERIKISESVSLIILSPSEMHGVSPRGKEFLLSVLRAAFGDTAALPSRGKVYVEMYQSENGGCELFVSKPDLSGGKPDMPFTDEKLNSEYKKSSTILRNKRAVYLFDNFSALLSCCKRLHTSSYSGKSTAYRDGDNKNYYLVLDRESHLAVEEMGSSCRSQVYYYINEHCDKICSDDAIEKLGRFA